MKRFLANLLLMVCLMPFALRAEEVKSKFFYDLNSGIEGWKSIDVNDDSQYWTIHEDGYIYSVSSDQIKPNNIFATLSKYAIYPTSKISFDVKAEISVEKYGIGIAYSLDGANFIPIHDETSLPTPTEWNNIEISLDYLAGKEVYLGILHYTYDNQGTIFVDNIKLTDGMLNTAKDVVATEVENNVNLTWVWDEFEATQEPCGYRVYRMKDNGNAVMIADNVTATTYQDNQWSKQEWGIYKWGVAALYVQQQTRGSVETLFEEGFETTDYYTLPEGWTKLSAPESSSVLGPWYVETKENTSIIAPYSGNKFAFSYGNAAEADFYMITPAIDLTKAINPTLEFCYANPGIIEALGNTLHIKYSESPTGPWYGLWTEQSNLNWKKATIDLSMCSGGTVYIAFVNEDHKGTGNFGIGIDNVSIKSQLSENALPVASRIAWSNAVEKDMNTVVKFTVAADDNGSTAGASITLKNIDEPRYIYEATANATGYYQFQEVRRGNYEYTVSLNGYYPATGTIAVFETVSTACILEKMPESIEGLYVSPTAWAMWEYNNANTTFDIYLDGKIVEENYTDKYYQYDVKPLVKGREYKTTIRPKDQHVMLEYTWVYVSSNEFAGAVNLKANKEGDNKAVLTWEMPIYEAEPEPVYEFSVNFDNGTLEGWTNIDGDGDAHVWRNTAEYAYAYQGFGINNTYCATSWSYESEKDKPLNPNNFLVSGSKCNIVAGSKLTYSISAQSKQYPNEHYGVAISTNSNTNPNDFEVIFEETLEAGVVDSISTQGQWFERTIDLSAYAGQSVYIAFRHYDSRGNYWIKLDDISLTIGTTRGNREEGEWLYYDNGKFESALGLQDQATGGPMQIYWAIMFPAETIEDYAKRPITKVAIYDYEAHSGAFSIHEGGDVAPGNMIHVQTYETTGKKAYVEIELTTPVVISGKENVWIQFSNESGYFVAAYSVDMGDYNSRWMSQDGINWVDNDYYNCGAWMIRAYVGERNEAILDEPETTTVEPIGAIIYRNGNLITPKPIKETTYTDTFSEDEETVEYAVRVVYGGEKNQTYYAMSLPTATTFVTKEPLICVQPQNLYGETTYKEDGTFGATLVWPYVKEWLFYDNGTPKQTFGGSNAEVYWGIMFPAKDLAKYAGSNLTKVALYNKYAGDATLTISYGGDFAPGTPIHSQNFTFLGEAEEGIFEVKLTAPVPVSGEENIWVTVYQKGTQYPAVATENTGDPNGRWISFDGNSWCDLLSLDSKFNYTWFLRAYVSTEVNRDNGEFDHYNIYRSTTNGNYQLIGETKANTYFDKIDKGTYYYQVKSVYTRGEESCESEAATAYGDNNKNYVVVEVTKIDENGVKGMMVYPNPAKDMLNITAENMRRITISNVLGQVVYDREANSDNEVVNMSQYEAGFYLVRIATENGVAVKRISVTK